MKIVNRAVFLAMPAGTVFAKYHPSVFDELLIKGESIPAAGDFFYQDIVGALDVNGSERFVDVLHQASAEGAAGPDIGMDFDCESRDGLFDEDQLFAVWSRDDVEALIARLGRALELAGAA